MSFVAQIPAVRSPLRIGLLLAVKAYNRPTVSLHGYIDKRPLLLKAEQKKAPSPIGDEAIAYITINAYKDFGVYQIGEV
jgi:hypothetical protein